MKKLIIIFIFLFVFTPLLLAQHEESYSVEKVAYDDDKTANDVEYFGFALPGTATSASTWKIFRITYTGNDFVLQFADGNQNYDNEFDERDSLTYK